MVHLTDTQLQEIYAAARRAWEAAIWINFSDRRRESENVQLLQPKPETVEGEVI